MADQDILSNGTEDVSDVSTEPTNQSFVDAADALDTELATSETDGAAEANNAEIPQNLKDQISGFKGRVSQQEKELKELRAKMAELETVSKEAAAARAELQKLQAEQASATLRNQAQFEMSQRVEAAVADYAREMELRGVFAVVDDETKAVMLDRYRKAELKAELERFERANTDTRLQETDRQRQQREYREKAIQGRDKVVAREAAKLTNQLKAVGIDRPITPEEIIGRLKKDVTADDAFDELQDVSEVVYNAAVAEAKKAARKAGIAERDAVGADTFERGGSSTLSPSEIFRRYGEGDMNITYKMAREAEAAMKRTNSL